VSGAIISDCGTYRYALWREWTTGEGTCLFVMLNPSTADASEDDPTIRRCIGFAQRWGYQRLAVGNLYALRATDPKALTRTPGPNPVGELMVESNGHTYANANDEWLRRLCMSPDTKRVIVAWGAHPDAQDRAAKVADVLTAHHFPVECLGRTKSGAPKHPLYLAADTEPQHFDPHSSAATR
jgi:hypothetical protein